MTPQVDHHRSSRAASVLWGLVSVLSLGLIGLVLTLPPLRRRRAAKATRCTVCRRHRRRRRAAAVALTCLLLVGVAGRGWAVVSPPATCTTHVSPQEPAPDDAALGPVRDSARGLITAPTSGLALLISSALGMSTCDAQPVLVAFWPEASGGGTTVGDTFVAWMPPAEVRDPRLEALGIPSGSMPYGDVEGRPFGPRITSNRADARLLAGHESRHTDQWTVSTVLGGALTYPFVYFVTDAILPGPHNPFERDAGLQSGGYEHPTSAPSPRWGTLAVLGLLALLLLGRRLRWCSRVVRGGRRAAVAHVDGRCPVHSPGWFSAPSG